MDAFNAFDYIVLVIFFLSMIIGFGRGLLGELMSLGTLVVAFFVAANFATPLANVFTSTPAVQGAISQTTATLGTGMVAQSTSYVAIAISFVVLFGAVIVLGAILGYVLNVAMQTGMLGIGNRLLGGLFGLIRGYILNLVMIFVLQLTPMSAEAWYQQSYFTNLFQPQVAWLGNIVTPAFNDIKTKVGDTIQSVTSQIKDMVG